MGYSCIAPQIKDGAILYSPFQSIENLPQGISDYQSPGSYKLKKSQDKRLFNWSNGPQALKPILFSPHENLWRAEKNSDGKITFVQQIPEITPLAIIGLRSCDLAAMESMDRHFLRPDNPDPWYKKRRENLLLVAVNCVSPSNSCFCVSTGTGPEATSGYDLRLHECDGGFLVNAGTEQGEKVLDVCQPSPASQPILDQVKKELSNAVAVQSRGIAANDFRSIFSGREDDSIWDEIASRCLGCGNCTAVCPTCFCHREEDSSGLDLENSVHHRVWDSCFSAEHSMLHGQPVRKDVRERYRQWMTHKLSGWHDQFGESGCVGCGRCITWCPVGIDLVAESASFISLDNGEE